MPPPTVYECFSEFEFRWGEISHPAWADYINDNHTDILEEIYHNDEEAERRSPSDFVHRICLEDPVLNELMSTFNQRYEAFLQAEREADQEYDALRIQMGIDDQSSEDANDDNDNDVWIDTFQQPQ